MDNTWSGEVPWQIPGNRWKHAWHTLLDTSQSWLADPAVSARETHNPHLGLSQGPSAAAFLIRGTDFPIPDQSCQDSHFLGGTRIPALRFLSICFCDMPTSQETPSYFLNVIFIGVEMLCNIVLVSAVQWSESAIRMHISPPSWTSHYPPFCPSRSSQSTELSSLCYTAGSH